ncbi:MAG: DUF1501 domain-containing protein [Caulobacter sp.]|nr:DUF1501 domain-containing protein [Caulobacter sp.]
MTVSTTRRGLLAAAAGLGLSIGLMGRAHAEGDLAKKKLIVVVARGGMDGLSVAPPVGDADYEGLRRSIAVSPDAALKLDGTFGLHPSLAGVHGLALKGQARIAPAVASPDRQRSHFEAQDVLESGGAVAYGAQSGFLNRTLAATNGRPVKALSVGATAPLILRGKVSTGSWSPGLGAGNSPRLPAILGDLYAGDPLLGPALARGLEIEGMAATAKEAVDKPGMGREMDSGGAGTRQGRVIARNTGQTVAGFMRQPNGPQIVAVSVDGWDTHANAAPQMTNRLLYLDALLMGLHDGLGDDWKDTVVVVATEFGRTARVNGTNGTDHGTASTALLLGGALKSGGIVGDWPTLKPGALFENRDTAPATDLRAVFKGVLADHMGVDRRALDEAVFPGSAGVKAVSGIV